MKRIYLFLIVLISLGVISCGDDNEPIPSDRTVLNYDGDNITAPTLPQGLYEFAVRFPEVVTRNVSGRNIEEVSFYLYDVPAQLFINISPDFTPSLPGDILNTQQVTNLQSNSWNTVRLDQPYSLDGTPVWVGIEVTLNDLMQTVGCDSGPANPNGDWLYDEENREWDTFRSRTNDNESVNWNIRVVISD